MKATVAICTYNRSNCLPGCIGSVFAQETSLDYEVIVVDNNSTDDTAEVVARLQTKYPSLKYVLDENQGLSHARNRALRESSAEIVAFVDDDGVAEPGWLEQLVSVFEDSNVAVAGGKIELVYPVEPPDWWRPEYDTYLSKLDLGDGVKQVDDVYGCNYAVRRRCALELGGFDTELGFSGGSLVPGEETDLCKRIQAQGYKIVYNGRAVVQHHIEQDRMRKDWIRKRRRADIVACQRLAPSIADAANGYLYSTSARLACHVAGNESESFWYLLEQDRYAWSLAQLDQSYIRLRALRHVALGLPRTLGWFIRSYSQNKR